MPLSLLLTVMLILLSFSAGLNSYDLVKNGIITSTTLKKIRCGDPVSLNVIGKICVGLGVGPEAVVEFKTLDGTVKSL